MTMSASRGDMSSCGYLQERTYSARMMAPHNTCSGNNFSLYVIMVRLKQAWRQGAGRTVVELPGR
jgi:hypothetical protein